MLPKTQFTPKNLVYPPKSKIYPGWNRFFFKSLRHNLLLLCLPVYITPGCVCIHFGTQSPMNKENPNINKFLDEFRSTKCNGESPTELITANIMQKMPPIIGSGMVTKRAPNFPSIPNNIIRTDPNCKTLLLATYK